MKKLKRMQIVSLLLVFAILLNLLSVNIITSYALSEGYSADIEELTINLGTTKPGYNNSDFIKYFTVTNTGTNNFYYQNTRLDLQGANADKFIAGLNNNGTFSTGVTNTTTYFIKPVSDLTTGEYTVNVLLQIDELGNENYEELDSCTVTFTVTDHNFSSEWTTNTEYHWHACLDDNCTEQGELAKHDKSVIKDAVEPTFDTDGYTGDQYCSVCNYKVSSGKPIAAGKYIRESRATMTPSSLIEGSTPADYEITSTEPAKYSVTVGNWWDLTTEEQITSTTTLINNHQYRIIIDFDSVGDYVYNEELQEYGSEFYLNGEKIGTTMSVAYTTYRTYDTVCTNGSTPSTYTVTFDTKGGSDVASQQVENGQCATKPNPDPTKNEQGIEYTLTDWYEDDTCTTPFDFSKPITDNITIYAGWAQVQQEPIVYEFKEINGKIFTVNADKTATFAVDADYSLFVNGGSVYVDDILVSPDNYTSKSGSTVITFKEDYIKSLNDGEHSLRVAFSNGGTASTNFTLSKTTTTQTSSITTNTVNTTNTTDTDTTTKTTGDSPKTGDSILIWVGLLIASALGIVGIYKIKKNKE